MGQNKNELQESAPRKVGRPRKSPVKPPVDYGTDNYLRAESIVNAINEALPHGAKQLKPIPSDYVFRAHDRQVVEVAHHAAFQLIGGVPRMVQWATENPSKFYELYARLLPPPTDGQPQGTTINFVSAVPASPLDNITVSEDGTVLDITVDDIPE